MNPSTTLRATSDRFFTRPGRRGPGTCILDRGSSQLKPPAEGPLGGEHADEDDPEEPRKVERLLQRDVPPFLLAVELADQLVGRADIKQRPPVASAIRESRASSRSSLSNSRLGLPTSAVVGSAFKTVSPSRPSTMIW